MIKLAIIHQNFPKPLPNLYKINSLNFPNIPANPTSEQWEILRLKLIEEFEDVFDSEQLKPIAGSPVHIYLKAITCPRKIPFAWRSQVKDELDEMVRKGIITPVDEATDFVSPLVVVQKSNGKIRVCVDFTKLNKFVSHLGKLCQT